MRFVMALVLTWGSPKTSCHHFGYHGGGLGEKAVVTTCCEVACSNSSRWMLDSARHKWGVLRRYTNKTWYVRQGSWHHPAFHYWARYFQQPCDFYLLQWKDWAWRHTARTDLGRAAVPPEDRALPSSLLFSSLAVEEDFCARQGTTPSFPSVQLTATNHTLAGGCSLMFLMFPAEHHESAGLRPIILWLFVIMTLGRMKEKKNLKWINKVCMPGLYTAYVHCLASVSGVNNMFLLSSLVLLIILSLYLSPNP